MADVVREMSAKKLGMTCVVDGGRRLAGIVTDGDLRRRMLTHERPLEGTAKDAMTPDAKTIAPDALATDALRIMEHNKITSLPVIDDEQHVLGVIQIHDLWRTELF